MATKIVVMNFIIVFNFSRLRFFYKQEKTLFYFLFSFNCELFSFFFFSFKNIYCKILFLGDKSEGLKYRKRFERTRRLAGEKKNLNLKKEKGVHLSRARIHQDSLSFKKNRKLWSKKNSLLYLFKNYYHQFFILL